MSVGSISANPLYTLSIQCRYFGTAISEDKIKDLMTQYGIKPSGNASYDVQALYDAMYTEASSDVKMAQASFNTQSSQSSQQSSQPEVVGSTADVPWANLMSQVGVPLTGTFEGDYNAFNQRINAMSIAATTQQEKASIDQLEAEASIVFVQPDQPSQASSQTDSKPQQQVSGADIIAQLNKMYLLG